MTDSPPRDDWLLEYHLGALEEPRRSWIEAELIRDAELRARSDRLRATLRPLDFAGTPVVPPTLVDRILGAVHRAEAGHRHSLPRRFRIRGFGARGAPFRAPRDVLAAAASVALLASLAWPGFAAVRHRARQTACMSNLGSIFQGVRLYQASFAEALPYAGGPAGAAWLGDCGDMPVSSNSRHLYLLARLHYVADPASFVCPSASGGTPMPREQLARADDFASARNISYDSLNLAGPAPCLRPARSIAYLGDSNPLFIGGKFHRGLDPYTTNSPAHGGRGQAVLLLDGSVSKLTSPLVGRDNVWIAGDIREYRGTETPADEHDSFLVPGCPGAGDSQRVH